MLPLREVCLRFIDYLRQVKEYTKADLTLVSHSNQDLITIAVSVGQLAMKVIKTRNKRVGKLNKLNIYYLPGLYL